MWSRRLEKYHHYNTYAILYLDGHAELVSDLYGNYMRAKQTIDNDHRWFKQEVIWLNYFDKK